MPKWTPQQKSQAREAKRLGLISQDLRKAPTRYLLSRLHDPQIAAAISGEARVIKTPSSKAARSYSNTFKTYKDRVIVPKSAAPGQQISYSRKQSALTADGKPITRLSKSTKSGYQLHVHLRSGGSKVIYEATNLGDIQTFLGSYAQKFKGEYSVTHNGVLIDL